MDVINMTGDMHLQFGSVESDESDRFSDPGTVIDSPDSEAIEPDEVAAVERHDYGGSGVHPSEVVEDVQADRIGKAGSAPRWRLAVAPRGFAV